MWLGVCSEMCMDVCTDVHIDMCIGTCIDMCIGICIDACVEMMCIDTCMEMMCTDTCMALCMKEQHEVGRALRHMHAHEQIHQYRHVYTGRIRSRQQLAAGVLVVS